MSERKVLNKYYPPNFDPAKIPRRRIPRDQQHKVRLMTPFSMRCETCGEYVYKGKKFNARKETVLNEQYLNIKIFRFYIKCPRCAAEITFKTDPKNADYEAEHGASRNFEPWRDESKERDLKKGKREREEENNPMKKLENRTHDSRQEMDVLDQLDELRTANARLQRVNVGSVEERIRKARQDQERKQEEDNVVKLTAEDERLAETVFRTSRGIKPVTEYHSDDDSAHNDDDEEEEEEPLLDLTRPSLFACDTELDPSRAPSSSTNTTGKRPAGNGISRMIHKKAILPQDIGSSSGSSSAASAEKPKVDGVGLPSSSLPCAKASLNLVGGAYDDSDESGGD